MTQHDNASAVVHADSISKLYRVYASPVDRLKELLSPHRGRKYHREVHAVEDVSFELARGDRLGILGENGSGKSTLLRIIAGVLEPTAGTIRVNGRVAALLELGSSFNAELSGRENVYQFGAIMGYAGDELEERFRRIHEFSEIGDFVEQPMKTYSSGMSVRLAFAASVFVEPDILIIDEALAVGDAYFQAKCTYKIRRMLDEGCTFIYVSHSPDSVRTLCNRALLLDRGRVIREGECEAVTASYASQVFARQVAQAWYGTEAGEKPEVTRSAPREGTVFSRSPVFESRVASLRQGTGESRITDVQILDEFGSTVDVARFGERLIIRVSFESLQPMPDAVAIGVGVCDPQGTQVLQFMSHDEGVSLPAGPGGDHYVVEFAFENCLGQGVYSVNAGLSTQGPMPAMPIYTSSERILDATFGGLVFSVIPFEKLPIFGKVRIPVQVTLREGPGSRKGET